MWADVVIDPTVSHGYRTLPEWYYWFKFAVYFALVVWTIVSLGMAVRQCRRDARAGKLPPKWDFRRSYGEVSMGFPVAPYPTEAVEEVVRRAREQDESPPVQICEDRL